VYNKGTLLDSYLAATYSMNRKAFCLIVGELLALAAISNIKFTRAGIACLTDVWFSSTMKKRTNVKVTTDQPRKRFN